MKTELKLWVHYANRWNNIDQMSRVRFVIERWMHLALDWKILMQSVPGVIGMENLKLIPVENCQVESVSTEPMA